MNKNCIVLVILDGGEVYPLLSDYEGPCERFTEDEAATEINRLKKQDRESWEVMQGVRSPSSNHYQVVTILS